MAGPLLRCRAGFLQQIAGLDFERIGDLAENCHASRYVAAFDRPDITHTQARPIGEFFLRQLFIMTCPTQISRHDLLEIHDERGTSIGTIILGTIIPIRRRSCYSSRLSKHGWKERSEMREQPALDPDVEDEAPSGLGLTPYDRQHFVTYLRLLDAQAEGADWKDVARIVLHREPVGDEVRTRRCWESHLARAQWLSHKGYRQILEQEIANNRP